MVQRSLVTFLAALGGILVILGGLLGLLLSFGPYGYGPRFGVASIVVLSVLAIIFGLAILIFSGVTHFRATEQNLAGGVVLIVLGLVTWIISGGLLLVAVGSFLTIVAGLVLVVWLLMDQPRLQVTQSS